MSDPTIGHAIPDAVYYEAVTEGINVYSWSPSPPGVPGLSTQVHMIVPMGPARVLFRFKGPGTLDDLIAALRKHRADVWGPDGEK